MTSWFSVLKNVSHALHFYSAPAGGEGEKIEINPMVSLDQNLTIVRALTINTQ